MLLKTVKVTNPRNTLVQIPGFVIAQWSLKEGDMLELTYEQGVITIKPHISERRGLADCSKTLASASAP